MKKSLVLISVFAMFAMLSMCGTAQGAVGKTNVAVWRPEFAYHANDCERVVYVPAINTTKQPQRYAAFVLRSLRLNGHSYNQPTMLDFAGFGVSYKAKYLTMADATGDIKDYCTAALPVSAPHIRYYGTNDFSPADWFMTWTIPSGYGTNAEVRLLAFCYDSVGIAKLQIDGSATLVNGSDTYLSGSDRLVDFYRNNNDSVHLSSVVIATGLDTTNTHTLKFIFTNTKNASSGSKYLRVVAAVVIDRGTPVDPDVSCWIDGLYSSYPSLLASTGDNDFAYSVNVNSAGAQWLSPSHFGTSNCYANSGGSESWVIAHDGTTWSPSAGDRAAAPFLHITENYGILYPGAVSLCNWVCEKVFEPGKYSQNKAFSWTANNIVVAENSSYDTQFTLSDSVMTGLQHPSYLTVPDLPKKTITSLTTQGIACRGQLLLTGGSLNKYQVSIFAGTKTESLSVVDRTGDSTKDRRLYMVRGTGNRNATNGTTWISETTMTLQEEQTSNSPFSRTRRGIGN